MALDDELHSSEKEHRAARDRRDNSRRLDERRRLGIGEIRPEQRLGPRRNQDLLEEEVVALDKRVAPRRKAARREGPRRKAEDSAKV